MPSVSLVAPDAPIRADAVVVGIRSTKDGVRLAAGAERVDAALEKRLSKALAALGAKGRPDEVHRIPTLGLADFPLVVATGVGGDPGDAEAVRRAVGAAIRGLSASRRVHVAIDAPVGPLAEGALLGAYRYTEYKSNPPKPALRAITVPGTSRAELRRAVAVAEAVLLTRDLVNTPPNDLYPQAFADRASALATARGLVVEVLDERALKRGKYGGIIGVGQGSTRPPRLVRISYRPKRTPKGGKQGHVALVGKGITFDSGGLNLKTANMSWMKSDMGGAAAVIASILALAELKVPVAVTATVPMAENMPSGTSYRPSDVLTMRNGSTVEVA
ncbi:MAG: leucyl aminopeptidase, partial [Pseudonocardiales bacterium]|nr:leucyl aminopeptidase [Pseudonocardiales bacterium]